MSALYRQKLLIADRSEDYCCLLAGILKGKYEIRCCCTGPETVELLESFQPDVLILDVCMPMLDGIRILRTEGIFRPAAIIALISSNGDALMKQLTFLGVDHIMLKPCNIPSLLNRLEEFRQMQQLRIPSHAASYGRVSKMLTQLSFPPGRNTEYISAAIPGVRSHAGYHQGALSGGRGDPGLRQLVSSGTGDPVSDPKRLSASGSPGLAAVLRGGRELPVQ